MLSLLYLPTRQRDSETLSCEDSLFDRMQYVLSAAVTICNVSAGGSAGRIPKRIPEYAQTSPAHPVVREELEGVVSQLNDCYIYQNDLLDFSALLKCGTHW
jgi:hypothetical protein